MLGFAYILIRQMHNPSYKGLFGGLNLGIHEFGHLVFGLFGEFLGMAGGTIMQLLVPFYGVYNFVKQDDHFSAVLCFGWLSTSCYDVASYAADARAMALPLVSPFGAHVYHDWNYLLTRTGLLEHDASVGVLFRLMGFLSMSFALGVGSWMIALMLRKDNIGDSALSWKKQPKNGQP